MCIRDRESDITVRALRDYLREDTDSVIIDDLETYQKARDFINFVMPHYLDKIKFFDITDHSLFAHMSIESQVKNVFNREVALKSGATIVFDPTEALTAIDIDLATHKTAQSHPLKLAEALAEEIFWQIRLRKLSGIILIDYPREKNLGARDHFHSEIKRIASQDDYKLGVHGWTRTGLLELTKDRLGPSLRDMFLCKNSASQFLIEVIAIEACRTLITGSDGIAIPQLVCSKALKSALLGPLRKTFDKVKKI